jgi:hypothetical protein
LSDHGPEVDVTKTNTPWTKWLELAVNLSVVAGIVLLALEINQNSRIVRAQLESEAASGWIAIDASKQSERFSATLAHAIESPEELSLAEMVELDGYLFTYIDQLSRHRALLELGLVDQPVAAMIDGSIRDFMGNRYAQAWWAETKNKFSRELVGLVDERLSTVSPDQDLDYYLRIRGRLQSPSEGS